MLDECFLKCSGKHMEITYKSYIFCPVSINNCWQAATGTAESMVRSPHAKLVCTAENMQKKYMTM